MKTDWRRGMLGSFLVVLAWAAAWGAVAVLVALIIDPDGSMDEMWPAIGAYPGFLSGAVFFALLALAERRRALAELPLSRVATWGAVAGLIVGVVPFIIGEASPEIPVWFLAGIVIGSFTMLSTLSAILTARWFGRGARRSLQRA